MWLEQRQEAVECLCSRDGGGYAKKANGGTHVSDCVRSRFEPPVALV